jgi:uncharacterized protein
MTTGIATAAAPAHLQPMRISELHVYPVKGAAGIALQQAELDSFGIRHDRRWMIVAEADGAFITQRDHPQLALLLTQLEPDALVLRSRHAGEVRLPLEPSGGARRSVGVWADEVDADDSGDEAASFVSAHLDIRARLMYMPGSSMRQADLDYARPGDRVSFADGFPLLLISQQSLDELNARLDEPVPMLRFRPNVVVDGAPAPHAEDAWRSVRLGSVTCDVVKPCARCAVTTVDQATGVPGKEPLRSLADYRRWDGKVWFGQNVVHRGTGTLSVGDAVSVLEEGVARPVIVAPAV